MQRACHVGWRQDHGEHFALLLRLSAGGAAPSPQVVPIPLHRRGVVDIADFTGSHVCRGRQTTVTRQQETRKLKVLHLILLTSNSSSSEELPHICFQTKSPTHSMASTIESGELRSACPTTCLQRRSHLSSLLGDCICMPLSSRFVLVDHQTWSCHSGIQDATLKTS